MECLDLVSTWSFHTAEKQTGVRSEVLIPRMALPLPCDWTSLPSMSTIITSLIPVLVSQPYMAKRSSIACSSPKSWPTGLLGMRASKISSELESMKENSSLFRASSAPSAENNEMCKGLFCSFCQYYDFRPVARCVCGCSHVDL